MTEEPVPEGRWPGGADVAVAMTFDVDAEAAVLSRGPEHASRLTAMSAARFGVIRGLPRISEVLGEFGVPGTFYVPGDTAQRHTDALAAIVQAGHEIGHHGYLHLRSDRISGDAQRQEIERGLDALRQQLGVTPAGYRSPAWELTPETLALLDEYGFMYDSSCMGDDRPYIERHGGTAILELPVHWSLDDWCHFQWTPESGGNLSAPGGVLQTWLDEFDSALADRRLMTLTMHPEVIGRGYRIGVLQQFIEQARERANVWFATHSEMASHLRAVGLADDRPWPGRE